MDFEVFKKKYEKVTVEHYPNNIPKQPTISVSVHIYQHANYIKHC